MKLSITQYFRTLLAAVVCLSFFAAPSVLADSEMAEEDASQQVQQLPGSVNINAAPAEELAMVMSGIGLKKAQAIVAWRSQNGDFTSVDQLAEVKGVGPATITKNLAKLTL